MFDSALNTPVNILEIIDSVHESLHRQINILGESSRQYWKQTCGKQMSIV